MILLSYTITEKKHKRDRGFMTREKNSCNKHLVCVFWYQNYPIKKNWKLNYL